MTFKSVTEVLRAHGEALKEIENALPAKANKVDMA
jgi:DNA-binding transcriptional regulator WhiA